jgi:hypothetical protein
MKIRFSHVALIGYFGCFLLFVAGLGANWIRTKEPPEQPIAFPHTIHVSRLGLSCNFCHLYVDKGKRATAPPLEKCMSCHKSVAKEKPEIQKLTGYYERRQPIHWNRIHFLPPFVYFTHKRHIKAGIDCSACHGEIGSMVRVRRVRSLEMGWCITCHRSKGAPHDCSTCHQ